MSPKVLSEFKGIFERGRHLDWKLFVGKVRVYKKDYHQYAADFKACQYSYLLMLMQSGCGMFFKNCGIHLLCLETAVIF